MGRGRNIKGLWVLVFPASRPRPTPHMDAFHAERRPGRCGICDWTLTRKRREPTVCQVDTGRDCVKEYQQLLALDYQHRASLAADYVVVALVAWMLLEGRPCLPLRAESRSAARKRAARSYPSAPVHEEVAHAR